MMTRPWVWTLEQLLHADMGQVAAWATPSVREVVRHQLPFPLCGSLSPLPADIDTLVVVGGGTLIDEAKLWLHEHTPAVKLVAVPSMWGSGAENSPVIAVQRDGRKVVRFDPAFLPYARVTWPALARSIPPRRARYACGDTWAHALEGFFSPIATDELRLELVELIRTMLRLPLTNDSRWFDVSAAASAAQARSSVGLVHGIAHTIEGPLRTAQPKDEWGHAKLCSLFLWPVMRFDRQASKTWEDLLQRYDLDPDSILAAVHKLFDSADYAQALPVLQAHWTQVLRDPCTRTNCALVRAGQLSYFECLGAV